MEVLYDLDTEAKALCVQLGLRMARAGTAGVHPRFVRMIRELVSQGAVAVCDPACCPVPARPPVADQRGQGASRKPGSKPGGLPQ